MKNEKQTNFELHVDDDEARNVPGPTKVLGSWPRADCAIDNDGTMHTTGYTPDGTVELRIGGHFKA